MLIKLNEEDITQINSFENYDLSSQKLIEEELQTINEYIDYWLEIIEMNVITTNLGKYYSAFLFVRDFLQFYIENSSQETSQKIESLIKPADDFFKSKMNTKKHHYENAAEDLKRDNYFWHTHSIHPIDLSDYLEKEKTHPKALEILNNDEFFFQKNSIICPFGDKFGRTSLWEFRDWRCVRAHEPLVDLIDWIFESFKVEKSDYISKKINTYQKRELVLDKTIISTIFAQLVDEGKIDIDVIPIGEVAIKKQIKYAEITRDKLGYKIRSFFNKKRDNLGEYIQNQKRLLEILNEMK